MFDLKSSAVNNLTVGNVRSQLIKYSIPVIITSLLQALYGIVDMIVVGQFLGSSGISGVNNGSQIMFYITSTFIGLSHGGNILISQYFGRGDDENRRKTTGTFFTMFSVIGLILGFIIYALSGPILRAMNAPAYDEAYAYLACCAWGVFFISANNAIISTMRAVGNSRKLLHFGIISCITNLILDIIFIGPLKMGTFGAALATVIAQGVHLAIALHYLVRQKEIFVFKKENFKIDPSKAFMILKLGVPTAIQWSVAGISHLVVTFLINDYGIIASAASGMCLKVRDIGMLFLNGISISTASMIAQNLGTENYDRAKKTMYEAMKISFGMAVIIVSIIEIFSPQIMSLFTSEEATIAWGVYDMRIEILAQLSYSIFMIYHSLMTGAGHTKIVLFSSFVNCILFRVPLALVLNHFFQYTGLYIALAIAPSISIPIGMIYTRSNVWRISLAAKTAESAG